MEEYRIYTDSAADIPEELLRETDICFIPMDYMLNGVSVPYSTDAPNRGKLCEDLTKAQREGADVHTSQITPYRFTEFWEKELAEGKDILYLAFSSGLSATWENAVAAANMLKEDYPDRKVIVLDTLAATAGQGILVYNAWQNKEKGMTLEENTKWLKEKIPYMCHRFVVGDLDYLHKGGRVSAAVALIGGMLNIKPGLIIDDEGKLQVVSKSRGQNAAWKTMIKEYVAQQGVPDVPKLVFITHS